MCARWVSIVRRLAPSRLRDLGVGVPEREEPEHVGLLRRESADRGLRDLVGGRDANAMPIDGCR